MEKNEILAVISLATFIVLFAFSYILKAVVKENKKAKLFINICFPVLLLTIILLIVFLLPTKSDEKDKYKPLSTYGMYIFSFLLIGIIYSLTMIFDRKDNHNNNTKSIAFAGVLVGLSFALSYVKLFSLPQGGSITLASMLPLIIYSYIFGAKKGIMAGLIYGVLQFIQSPQVYEPMQVLLDYPIAFSAIGVAGIFKNTKIKLPVIKFIVGASVSCILRYCAHFLSGYYVFSSWAMEGYTAITWSLVYNLYVIVELGIVLVIGSVLFSSKAFVHLLEEKLS